MGLNMKIGIVTIQNGRNFGAVMQAFALRRALINMGHDVKIVNKSPLNSAKYPAYTNFAFKHFNLTKPVNNIVEAKNAKFDFDLIITGSDQIWSTAHLNLDPFFFATFANDKTIRASYAPSLGTSNPEKFAGQRLLFQKYLRDYDYISIREHRFQKVLQETSNKPVDVVLDPTQLLEKSEYMEFVKEKPYTTDYIYVHLHHFSSDGAGLLAHGNYLSEKLGLPIVHNLPNARFKFELSTLDSFIDPGVVVNHIYHASYVLSQSYHTIAFALIFQKRFTCLLKGNATDERPKFLLGSIGLENCITKANDETCTIAPDEIDWTKVNTKLWELRKTSIDYLYKITNGHKNKIDDYFISSDPFTCYGCGACEGVCPVGCITMNYDNEGFQFPTINHNKCVECNKCNKACPFNSKVLNEPYDIKAFLTYHKDDEIRKYSSSGGLFWPLAKSILSNGGYVIGVRMNEKFEAMYDIASNEEACTKFKYSKYVEAQHNDIYKKTSDALKTGKAVLFTGTPCKIAGLKNYLDGNTYANLYLIDIICYGVNSPVALSEWLSFKEKNQGSKLKHFQFRSPKLPSSNQATEYIYENGVEEIVENSKDLFMKVFLKSVLLRKCCYACEFTGNTKIADITIGDFWGWKNYYQGDSEKGISCLKINSEKGKKLFANIESELYIQEQKVWDIYRHNHRAPTKLNMLRGVTFNWIRKKGVENTFKEILEKL